LAPHKALKLGALSFLGEAGRMAQWVAAAGAALQRGAASVHADEVVQAAQEKAAAEAEAAQKREAEGAWLVGPRRQRSTRSRRLKPMRLRRSRPMSARRPLKKGRRQPRRP
jgi:hypothetical protein